MNVQVEDWELRVDIEQTRKFYASFPYNNEDMFGLNYLEVCSFCEPQILQFFNVLGVDILKPTALHFLPVEGDCIMYSGCYHIVGQRLQGELDEWDVVVEQFCFSLTEEQYERPDQLGEEYVEVSFEAVLPWIIFEPMPTI